MGGALTHDGVFTTSSGWMGPARGLPAGRADTVTAPLPAAAASQAALGLVLATMSALASQAGFTDLIAPVRPNLKERYPTIAIERYAHWTRPDGQPFDAWMRVHARLGPGSDRRFPARCG
jgi:hypothetical protein